MTNRGVAPLLRGVDPELLAPPNAYRIGLHPRGLLPGYANPRAGSPTSATGSSGRCGGAATPALPLCTEIRGYPGVADVLDARPDAGVHELLLTVTIADSDGDLALHSALTTFGGPHDVTLAELAVESFFPADASTRERLTRLAGRRGAGRSPRRTRRQHAADARDAPGRRRHARAGGGGEAVGGHRRRSTRARDRGAPPRRAGERHLRGARAGPDEVGREPGVHGRGRAGRVHLRAAVRAAPGDQRPRRRAARVRAHPQRAGPGRREPRHRRRGRTGTRAWSIPVIPRSSSPAARCRRPWRTASPGSPASASGSSSASTAPPAGSPARSSARSRRRRPVAAPGRW